MDMDRRQAVGLILGTVGLGVGGIVTVLKPLEPSQPLSQCADAFQNYLPGMADGQRVRVYGNLKADRGASVAGYRISNRTRDNARPWNQDFTVDSFKNSGLWAGTSVRDRLGILMKYLGEHMDLTFHLTFSEGLIVHSRPTTIDAVIGAFQTLSEMYRQSTRFNVFNPSYCAIVDGTVRAAAGESCHYLIDALTLSHAPDDLTVAFPPASQARGAPAYAPKSPGVFRT